MCGPFTGVVIRLKLHREEIFSLPFYTTSETTLRRLLHHIVPSFPRLHISAILTHLPSSYPVLIQPESVVFVSGSPVQEIVS